MHDTLGYLRYKFSERMRGYAHNQLDYAMMQQSEDLLEINEEGIKEVADMFIPQDENIETVFKLD